MATELPLDACEVCVGLLHSRVPEYESGLRWVRPTARPMPGVAGSALTHPH